MQIICKLSVPFGFIKLMMIIKVIIMAITSYKRTADMNKIGVGVWKTGINTLIPHIEIYSNDSCKVFI